MPVAKKAEKQAASGISVGDAIQLAIKLGATKVDEDAIRDALGDRHATTLKEIAAAFGVKETTVRNTWRRGANGMPGVSGKGGPGKFVWAEVLIWFLNYRTAAAQGRVQADEYTTRRREAETRAVEAEARIKERKAEVADGQFVPLTAVRSVLKGMLNVVRDTMLNIPRQLTPMFPAKFASQWTDEADRLIRNGLTIIAEKPIDDFLERMEDDVSISN